jgi:uncharacterized protein (DUF885 family)
VSDSAPESLRFDQLLASYYQSWFRFHPEAAVDAGVPGYAHLLTPCAEEDKGALVCLNDELRVELDDIDPAELDADRRIDYDILNGAVRLENRYLLDIEQRCPDPDRWLPVNAIYQLTVREVENFDAAMLARLAETPAHLSAAQLSLAANVRKVPALWAQMAAASASAGAEFVRSLGEHPRIVQSAQREALTAHVDQVAQALLHFAEFLERGIVPLAKGTFACGEKYFAHLLQERHFLDVDAAALHSFGEKLLARTQRELEAACQEQFGHTDVARALETIQSRHPSAENLLKTYTGTMRAAREFVVARGLVTVPSRERLDVVNTPVFLRHRIPFAAYYDPSPSDLAQAGYYYVTPPVDEAQLREHDEVGLMHTCVHEAYPGHHLHFTTVNASAASRALPRLMNASAACYEGWALYCEQLMVEEGFLKHPHSRIVLLRDRLWRALRVCLDVELHTRGLSIDAAADRMVQVLGFPRSQALADLAWYTQSPTVPLGYATGWALINALRDHLRATEAGFTLRGFHDRLLSAGAIALPLGIRRAFGEDTWNRVRDTVFGAS